MKASHVIVGIVALGAIAVWATTGRFTQATDGVQTAADKRDAALGERDLGTYMRVTAAYTYKGEPLLLDFGVSCGSIWEKPKQHPLSMDVFAGPVLYGVRTKDNKAVVIATNSYCDKLRIGDPSWGPPEDFLPITIVYDDPDTLYSGIMYASDEAYHNPNSALTEPHVHFERITKEQLLALRKAQAPNIVRSRKNNGDLAYNKFPGRRNVIGTNCQGWARVALNEKGRGSLRPIWPETRPAYWTPTTSDAQAVVARVVWDKTAKENPQEWRGGGLPDSRQAGLNRARGQGTVRGDTWYSAPPYYPLVRESANIWNTSSRQWLPGAIRYDVPIAGDQFRGFLSCAHLPGSLPPPTAADAKIARESWAMLNKESVITFGGQSVTGTSKAEMAPTEYLGPLPTYVVFRDEAIFVFTNIGTNSAGEQGDE